MEKLLATVCIFLSFNFACAEITLPRIFSDNMVLQAGMTLKIWGKSVPGASVRISFDGESFECKADESGEWSCRLSSRKPNATAQSVEIYENSKLSKTLKNILIGEIWIAGGQSNMEYKLKDEEHGKESNANATFPLIRVFTQNDRAVALKPQWDSPKGAQWQVCSPSTAWRFSAVGFYFARTIHADLNVPVGIIETPYSGSYMIPWIAREDLEGIKSFEKPLKKFESENANYDYEKEVSAYQEKLAEYKQALESAADSGESIKPLKKPGHPPIARGNMMGNPSLMYNAKIAPIAGFAVRGVVWYQGESDAKDAPEDFLPRFECLVESWRKYFARPDMAFCFVQLPSIDRDFWAPVRLAQAEAAKKIKNTAMAVSIDLGEEKDVHPKNKLTIGERLGNLALLKFYGRNMKADFPSVKSVDFKASKALVKFNAPNSKIKISGELRGFEVLVGGKWEIPQLKNQNGNLALASSGGRIDAVRYLAKGWALPDVCIFNEKGLPLGPFEVSRN